MQANEFSMLRDLLTDVMAYYGKDVSRFTMDVWWEGCKPFSYEQVSRAMQRHAVDPERGRFAPKLADVVAVLQGTQTDRSSIAWGKVLEAMKSIGAYTDVVFDDHVIHAVVDDLGGWPKLCRTPLDELGYVQTAFCKSYRAYAAHEVVAHPRRLVGERSPDSEYESRGLRIPMAMVGDREKCKRVYQLGGEGGKTPITFTSINKLLAAPGAGREDAAQDASFRVLALLGSKS